MPSRRDIFLILAVERFIGDYTRRGFRARGPLCGIGVMSLMPLICMPLAFSARMAASRPLPTPLTKTLTSLRPQGFAFSTAFLTMIPAAYGVDFFGPLKPTWPAEHWVSALPFLSVKVIIVLL